MMKSVPNFQFATKINLFSLSLISPLIRLEDVHPLKLKFVMSLIIGRILIFSVPISWLEITFSELRLLLEWPFQPSFQGIHGYSVFPNFECILKFDQRFLLTSFSRRSQRIRRFAVVSCVWEGLYDRLVPSHWFPVARQLIRIHQRKLLLLNAGRQLLVEEGGQSRQILKILDHTQCRNFPVSQQCWSATAHCWHRCKSWAHNLWVVRCRPCDQTICPTEEWRCKWKT